MGIEVHVIKAAWSEYADTLRQIREAVFIKEQNVPREVEWDGEDEASIHFLAVNNLGQYIGCARLLVSGQIGRMAVLQDFRGRDVGAELLKAVVEEGRNSGLDRLFLHAQLYAENFYRKGGFLPIGPEFVEADIPHVAMEMKLPVAFEPPNDVGVVEPRIRGQSVRPTLTSPPSNPTAFEGFVETTSALQNVIESARRRILILSPYLDHEIFDVNKVSQALSELARSAPKVEIRILIFSSKLIVDRGHQIIDLTRRLDEKIKIRVLAETPRTSSSSFVCADLDAYWLMPNYDNYSGIMELANPSTCKRLTEAFETAWDKSHDDNELRILRL